VLKYCPCTFVQEPRKTTKNLRIVGTPSEIRTGHLLETSRKYYPLRQLNWSTQWRFFMAHQPLVDQGLLIFEASRSHSVGLLRASDQLVTQHSYLTINNTHNRQTSINGAGFQPILLATKQPQTHALDRMATGIHQHTLELHVSMWFLSWLNK